jgi:anti-anti-sigma factor
VTKEPYAQNRFKYQYLLGDSIILRLLGPELKSGYKTCMIELKGEGCREFENKNLDKSWMDFLEFFVIRLNANPTRIDLTIDDYDGSIISFEWLKQQLDQENFTTNFKSKKYTIHGNSVDGYSIQMGNRSSVQELVIYEKNKEQIHGVHVDCSELDYISSAGLRVLLIMQKGCDNGVIIAEINEMIREILEQTGFDQILAVEDD